MTPLELNEYLDTETKIYSGFESKSLAKRITCADGESVSIQGNKLAYCAPRNNAGPYHLVEAGFPSCKPPESWITYAQEPDTLETVWG